MASIDYTVFANAANNLLTKFGSSATLTRQPAGTYDPNTSTAVVVPVTQTVTAVAFPYPEKMVDGTMILVGDLQVFIAPAGVTNDPRPGDKFTFQGATYSVIRVKNYKPTTVSVLIELQVRK